MPSKRLHLVTAIAVIASCLTASGLTIHTDFNSGLLEDAWRQPDGNDIVVADAGPDGVGDYAVRVAMDGGDNKVHFMTGNTGGQFSYDDSPFVGDFSGYENLTLSFDFRHEGAGSDLTSLRVHLWGPNYYLRAATAKSVEITTLDTSWQRLTFSLNVEDLVPFGPDQSTVGILNNIQGISIRNTPDPALGAGYAPQLLDGTAYYIDNIVLTAVPEPSTWGLLMGSTAFGVILWRRKRK